MLIERKSAYFPGYLFDFENLEKRLAQFPRQIFIGHGPHFWNNISQDILMQRFYQRGPIKQLGIIDLLLEHYDNFYCDVSGRAAYIALTRDEAISRAFLTRHSHKILYGTDNFHPGKMERLLSSFDLPPEKCNRIFYENASMIIPS